jgi:hypothetical protein
MGEDAQGLYQRYLVTKYRGEYKLFLAIDTSVIIKFRRAFSGFYRICAVIVENPASAVKMTIEHEHFAVNNTTIILEPIRF